MKKKKIIFIVPSLNAGGAERVISILVNNLDKDKFEVAIALLKKEGIYLNQINKGVKVIDLKCKRVRNSFFKILFLLKLEKPDIVFSTLGYLNLFIAIFRKFLPYNIKFVGRESSIVTEVYKQNTFKNKLFKFLYKRFYNNLDLIISQSEYMKKDLIHNYNVSSKKVITINNPVDIYKNKLKAQEDKVILSNKINLISVGSLRKVKRYDKMIEIISKLKSDKYQLYIIGDGQEEYTLKKKIKELRLENTITLLGRKENPFPYLGRCDLFLMTSEYEGFPNSVLEANSLGVPVLAFNSPGGLTEIIQNNVNGKLVNTEEEFIENIEKCLRLNKNSIQKSVDKYEVSRIIKKYEEVLINI
jgi:glycosyltransferase involved in cell wall biosynthesis